MNENIAIGYKVGTAFSISDLRSSLNKIIIELKQIETELKTKELKLKNTQKENERLASELYSLNGEYNSLCVEMEELESQNEWKSKHPWKNLYRSLKGGKNDN